MVKLNWPLERIVLGTVIPSTKAAETEPANADIATAAIERRMVTCLDVRSKEKRKCIARVGTRTTKAVEALRWVDLVLIPPRLIFIYSTALIIRNISNSIGRIRKFSFRGG